jgi:sterol 24-C-methyltransferase
MAGNIRIYRFSKEKKAFSRTAHHNRGNNVLFIQVFYRVLPVSRDKNVPFCGAGIFNFFFQRRRHSVFLSAQNTENSLKRHTETIYRNPAQNAGPGRGNIFFISNAKRIIVDTNQKKIVDYYSRLWTRLGFDFFLWGSKHHGYYPSARPGISEKEAQLFLQDLVADNLALKSSQNVLDAGCGQGITAAYLAKKTGAMITGITLVPFEVKKSEKTALKLGVRDKTRFDVMDYQSTDFPGGSFDSVYTTESLSHSPDIKKTLREFLRILKPGGRIALFEYTISPDSQFSDSEKQILDLMIKGSVMMGLRDFRHGQFTKTIEEAGFENVKEQNISENIKPSSYRFHKLSALPYKIISFFSLQKFFINTTAGYESYNAACKGLFRYCIFTGNKPSNPRIT